jgi:protein SCO1/2
VAGTLAAWAVAALLGGCEREAPARPAVAFKSTDITGASYAQGFELPDATGTVRTLRDFRGKVVVVFFGYTQCPDVCPTTLARIAEVRRLLGEPGTRVQAVFISVDPERDTPEVLQAYMRAFDDSFVALRGTAEQTAQVARHFKVIYQKVPGKDPGSYSMDHSAASYVFDPAGQVRLYLRHNVDVKDMAQDLKALLDGA